MENNEQGNFEKGAVTKQLEEQYCYDKNTGKFPYVVEYQELNYDLRDINQANGNAMYRLTSEARISLPEPSYIEVDKNGVVVREWN